MSSFDLELQEHDNLLKERGLDLWAGGEPTFVDRRSYAPEWTTAALGDDKQQRALGYFACMAQQAQGPALLRCLGRQYPDEPVPRWSFGVYVLRDGTPVWKGPPDPCLLKAAATWTRIDELRDALARQLTTCGYTCRSFAGSAKGCAGSQRLLASRDDISELDLATLPQLQRMSACADKIPECGLTDELAAQGLLLFAFNHFEGDEHNLPIVDLPAIASVTAFLQVLQCLADAANLLEVPGMVLSGFGPPVDQSVAFTTITPDPGVIEVNMAPESSAYGLTKAMRQLYQHATACELAPMRLHFNGDSSDSGGGGHLTLGASTPEGSLFLTNHRLLPRLIAYFSHHPALSYAFSEITGSSSQAPRVDESTRETLDELRLSLSLLDRQVSADPATIWQSVSPFLVDRTGNSHRCEINVEKLWNPFLPERGCLGLVEFRALRMPPTPERWGALAALWRSLVVMLHSSKRHGVELKRWSSDLHDQMALPIHLEIDLLGVLKELEAARLPLGPHICHELFDHPYRRIARHKLPGGALEIRKALEFWPIIGDAGSQRGTSRLVDPSTARVEFRIIPDSSDGALAWSIEVGGRSSLLPVTTDRDGRVVQVIGLRYRTHTPPIHLHPLVEARDPLTIHLSHPQAGRFALSFHSWLPEGGAYEGLPADEGEALARRSQRVILEPAPELPGGTIPMPANARTPWCIDTRWLLA